MKSTLPVQRLESKQGARDVQSVLISVDLATVHECKLAALYRKAERCDILLRSVVVPEVNVVSIKFIACCVHRCGIDVAAISLCVYAAALLDGDLVLVVVISLLGVSHEDRGP